MSVRNGPCDWPLANCGEGGIETPCAALVAVSEPIADIIETAAVEYLWTWSNRKYGLCPVTVRPCREECWRGSTYRGPGFYSSQLPYFGGGAGPLNPALIGGEWFNLGCGSCAGRCSCSEVSRVDLAGPVDSVTTVTIDGVVLSPAAYRVDNHRWLVRTDGGAWPTCQDMGADPDETGSFVVTYNIGIPVPAGGQLAAGVLACQMAKAACGDGTCELPQRIQTMTRQGITTAFLDSFDSLFERGTTGLFLVDAWIASENRVRRTGARIASPDIAAFTRTTSP